MAFNDRLRVSVMMITSCFGALLLTLAFTFYSSGVEVGIAWLRQLCTHTVSRQQSQEGTQYVSGTAVSSISKLFSWREEGNALDADPPPFFSV